MQSVGGAFLVQPGWFLAQQSPTIISPQVWVIPECKRRSGQQNIPFQLEAIMFCSLMSLYGEFGVPRYAQKGPRRQKLLLSS